LKKRELTRIGDEEWRMLQQRSKAFVLQKRAMQRVAKVLCFKTSEKLRGR